MIEKLVRAVGTVICILAIAYVIATGIRYF